MGLGSASCGCQEGSRAVGAILVEREPRQGNFSLKVGQKTASTVPPPSGSFQRVDYGELTTSVPDAMGGAKELVAS
jgi:hypothetical protein